MKRNSSTKISNIFALGVTKKVVFQISALMKIIFKPFGTTCVPSQNFQEIFNDDITLFDL